MDKRKLYEKKIIEDEEFPIQFIMNSITQKGEYFYTHWHEHIELHYMVKGSSVFYCNQKKIVAKEGSLVVFNSNEVHRGVSDGGKIEAVVMIFELSAFSREVAHAGFVFQNLITDDAAIQEMMQRFYRENQEKQTGYKLACKGIVLEVLTYLMRRYAVEKLNESEYSRRNKNLIRLNTVIEYVEKHYTEPVTNGELAELIHVSEDRFNHLFRDSMGISPLNYINEIRLKKAKNLLETGEYSVLEAATEVGFSDLNHFGRLFRKKYGCTPSSVWKK